MLVQERGDWNQFKQIFFDHWEGFKKVYPLYNDVYYEDLVSKMLSCGNPEEIGYIKYGCIHCGNGHRLVSMSCKSSLCLRCGKVYVDNWVSQISKMLHPGVIYRHFVLTVPKVFKKIFFDNSKKLLGALCICGVSCLDDFLSFVSKRVIKGGYIVVLQTHGRSGEYNVHLHIIGTSGGYDDENGKWVHLNYLPYNVLHKKWQWYLLGMLREELDTEEIDKLVDYCYKRYPKGFVANVQKGDVPNQYKSLAKYLAKYVVSPPISVRRIDEYNGAEVSYHYRSHQTKQVEHETVPVYTFIGRMIQHILPKGFKRIRYYGVQATKTYEKLKVIIHEALSKVKGVVKEAIKIIGKKTYRERYYESTGTDPLICPYCKTEMEIIQLWHPKYGTIYDELEEIKSGRYDADWKKTFEESPSAILSSSRGIQLSLFDMRDGASC